MQMKLASTAKAPSCQIEERSLNKAGQETETDLPRRRRGARRAGSSCS